MGGHGGGEHFSDWTAAVPLAGRLGLPPACGAWPVLRLYTGERQRLALVRAFAGVPPPGPRVLLLDEPTAGLDAASAAAVEALVAERRATAGTGVVRVTHDAAQAHRVARRWLVLEDGRLRARSPP